MWTELQTDNWKENNFQWLVCLRVTELVTLRHTWGCGGQCVGAWKGREHREQSEPGNSA